MPDPYTRISSAQIKFGEVIISSGTSFYKRGILQGTCPPGWPVIAINYSLRQSRINGEFKLSASFVLVSVDVVLCVVKDSTFSAEVPLLWC